MKSKKILLATFFVMLLMLLTPCISAVNVQDTEDLELNKNDEKTSEEILKNKKIDQTKINDLEKSDINLYDIIFRFLGFICWVIYSISIVMATPQLVVVMPVVGVVVGAIGSGMGILQHTGDAIERGIAGFLVTLITILVPASMSFHAWADGILVPEDSSVKLLELYMNLMDMFAGINDNPNTGLPQ